MTIVVRESKRMLMAVLACVVICSGPAVKSIQAQNLVQNPSAEDVDATGLPAGWGIYYGCGKAKLTVSSAEKHTGQRSAYLELTDWWTSPTNSAAQEANNAIVLCRNDGYRVAGSVPCSPETDYAYMFWYKGDFQSARVVATGWPDANAGAAQRISLNVAGSAMTSSQEWQRCAGTFRTASNVNQVALLIGLTAQRSVGENLGSIYVDDAYIRKKALPDSQIRGLWWYLKAGEREAGLQEIQDSFTQIKGAGFNTVFAWVDSLYLAALDRPELVAAAPQAGWDALGEVLKAANSNSLQVHAWFSPWIYKENYKAIELRDHPEWAAVDLKGVTNTGAVCFIRPEVRQFELDLITRLLDRYPDLAGIHLEEPGFPSGNYCYCQFCRQLARDWYAMDIRTNSVAYGPARASLAAAMCTDFVLRFREATRLNWPWIWLSANGGGGDGTGEWQIGRDWVTWARRRYLDFYVPQLYTTNTDTFVARIRGTLTNLVSCSLVPGIGVSWSGLYPERQQPDILNAQIVASQQLAGSGFVIFRSDYLTPELLAAVGEALRVREPSSPTTLRILATNSPSASKTLGP